MGAFIMPKIPEILVGIQMKRFVSVSSDHLWRWSTYFGRNIPTEIRRSIYDKPVLCPSTAISIGWPDLIGKWRSIFLRYSHLFLTGQFGIMESTLCFNPSSRVVRLAGAPSLLENRPLGPVYKQVG